MTSNHPTIDDVRKNLERIAKVIDSLSGEQFEISREAVVHDLREVIRVDVFEVDCAMDSLTSDANEASTNATEIRDVCDELAETAGRLASMVVKHLPTFSLSESIEVHDLRLTSADVVSSVAEFEGARWE
jgi:hypothetical protein